MFSVYSDGSSEGNSTGAIGWSWILVQDDVVIECGSGGGPVGTNNIAEMTGAIEGIKALLRLESRSEPAELVSDSQYVLGIAGGLFKAVKNPELAKEIRDLTIESGITTRWVKGHSGDVYNDMCDKLAKLAKGEFAAPKPNDAKKLERKRKRSLVKLLRRQKANQVRSLAEAEGLGAFEARHKDSAE